MNAPVRGANLLAALPAEILATDAETCIFHGQDVFTKSAPALAVVRPRDSAELARAVREITGAGLIAVPRGGGMSYTSGYLPEGGGAVVVDTGAMDRILEINSEDMYATVEAGCTWAALHAALKPLGLRTPFWGTLSGLKATIGGGVSQNSVFWGCGVHGAAADSVLGLEVVLADGRVLTTGSAAHAGAGPFWRGYGPDLTGLFLADCGALGFKSKVTLRLIPEAKALRYLSFAFDAWPNLFRAMSEIGRQGLATENFAFDPSLQAVRMKRDSLAGDVKKLANVMKASGSVLGAIKDAAQIAIAGRSFLDDVPYSVHLMVEGRSDAAADHDAAEVRRILAAEGGREVENSIPKIMRANPFGPLNSMLGPQGERWVPIHCLCPHSKAPEVMRAIEALFARNKAAADRLEIATGMLFVTVSSTAFVIEPVFLWPDETNELHKASVEPGHFAKLKGFPANLEARALVTAMRQELADLFAAQGCAHLQIGRSYRYPDTLSKEAKALLEAVKTFTDPQGQINPGVLGLG